MGYGLPERQCLVSAKTKISIMLIALKNNMTSEFDGHLYPNNMRNYDIPIQ